MRNEFNFFRDELYDQERLDEELEEDDEDDMNSSNEYEEEQQTIQEQLRQHLYGATDIQNDGIKNIIIDEDTASDGLKLLNDKHI